MQTHTRKQTQSVSSLISLYAGLITSNLFIKEACVRSPCPEPLQSTAGRCVANPGYPLLKTLEGRFLAPGDDGRAPLSADCPDKETDAEWVPLSHILNT